jgi:hypothetical protein
LNEEPNVGQPYASRDPYDDLLPIPNGDADDAHERYFEKIVISLQIQNRTYLRRTIKSDAPVKPTYEMV